MKLDKRVSDLEAHGAVNAPRKIHMLGRIDPNETLDGARATYGLGPNDLIIQIVGFSEVNENDANQVVSPSACN